MRIMLIAPPWLPVPPPAYGGTESVVDRLARGFVAAGHEVVLFTTGDSTCPVERRYFYEQSQGIKASAPVELRHLLHAYEAADGFDIVHDHTLLGPLYASGMTTTPVVTTNHGLFDGEAHAVYEEIARKVPIIAISHDQARSAVGIEIAAVIHHGIDIDPSAFRATAGDSLLFLGRMSPTKGAHRAARLAHQTGQRLIIAAKMREAPEKRYFEEQVRPLLDDRVQFVGEVGWREKLDLLGGARALIDPITWREPFGLVMIEALACGTPVLAFPFGAAPEIIREGVTGYVCADEAEMARRIGEIDRLDRTACRDSAVADFSTERMVNDHLALFRSILERAGRGREERNGMVTT